MLPGDTLSDESLLPGPQMAIFSPCPPMAKWMKKPFGVSFIRAIISSLPKTLLPNVSILKVRILTYDYFKG